MGFGPVDWIVLVVAAAAVALVLLRGRIEPAARSFAERTQWCMLAAAVAPIVLRLALLHRHPVPTPSGADDFAYLLLGDTLRHYRLANPAHPMRRFFEAVFILQDPTYSSIYPLGQGFALALGWMVFGEPWAGVALSMAAFCALCYWMLRGWVSAGWALAGTALAVMEFGPLCQWMNLYWGGAVGAIAGCLVFGSLPRILEERGMRPPVVLGLGLGLSWITRPFETALLTPCVAAYFWPVRKDRRRLAGIAALAALGVAPAIGLTLLQNKAVTGSWSTLPYALSRYQYGVPTTFTVQAVPEPHRPLTPEQQLDYQAQSIIHGERETAGSYFARWADRIHFYRFFFLTPLYLALPLFFLRLREFRYRWIAATVLVLSLGTNFYPYFYPHYIAVLTCAFVLVSVAGLQRVGRAAAVIVVLCGAEFAFWYGVHALADDKTFFVLAPYEKADFINFGDPEGRIAVNQKLAQAPGKHLVFVHYGPRHMFHEWIHNDADIDAARVVWAADLGSEEDAKLLQYYPDRRAWIVEPDAVPPRLYPYAARLIPAPAAAAPEPLLPEVPATKSRVPLRLDNGPVNNPGGIGEMRKKKD